MNSEPVDEARRTYDAFASSYDDFNHAYMNVRWTGRLLERARQAGLCGNRLLDVACGTGHSFIPMLERGWTATGSDISPAMLELAAEKGEGRVRLELADMRSLPRFGEFDLVWAVNDAVNYLLTDEELAAALTGMRRNLAPEGVVVFDSNTLATYRSFFGADHKVEGNGRSFMWSGQMEPDEVAPRAICEARFQGESPAIEPHVHRQRHFPEEDVLRAIDASGLSCVEVAGERDGVLGPGVDEELHTKAVYVCRLRTD